MAEQNESLDYEDFEEMNNMDDDEDDEEESEEEYDYTDDFGDDEHFNGFLKPSADVDADCTHDQILNYLRLGIDPKRSHALAIELRSMVTNGYMKEVAAGVVEFVCQCPPSNVEMVQRFQSIQALSKVWDEFGFFVTIAINDICDPEKPALNRIPARNLANFIRVLVEENIIQKDQLLISGTRDTALSDPYLERLHQVLYKHYGVGNPRYKSNVAATLQSVLDNATNLLTTAANTLAAVSAESSPANLVFATQSSSSPTPMEQDSSSTPAEKSASSSSFFPSMLNTLKNAMAGESSTKK